MLIASVFSPPQAVWDLLRYAYYHASHAWVCFCLYIYVCVCCVSEYVFKKQKKEGKKGKRECGSFTEERMLMWFSVWELNGPLNLENEKAEVAMIRGVPCWLLYECIQMCVYMLM